MEGENEQKAAKGSYSLQQVLLHSCNRLWKIRVWGWNMGQPFFFFSPLAHSLLILSILLHAASWVTVQFPEQFCNSRFLYRLFFDVPYWDAKAESAQILVCLVLFTNQYALIGWSSMRQHGGPLCVPFLSFSHFPKHHSVFSLCPFLHIHIHPKYPTQLYNF